MALVVEKEELDCPLNPHLDSLKVESNDSKDAKPPLAIIAGESMKAEDTKPDIKPTRIRYFMDAVVITTRPQYVATEGPRQVKGTRSSKRAAVKKESVSNPTRRNTVKVDEESGWVAPVQDDIGIGRSPNRSGSRSPTSVTFVPSKVISGTRSMKDEEDVVLPRAPVRLESPEATIPQLITNSSDQVAEKEGKMTKWKNPKMKVKKESAALTKDTIISRISAAGISFELFPVNCPDRDVMVSREFMSRTFGGSSQKTFPRIGKKKFAEHGLDDYMYLPTDYQPIAPEVPGAPGLWLDIGGEVSEWQGGVMRVFTRITTGPALWLYQGQYEIKVSKSLTPEEWQRQKVSVRKTWAKELVRKGWGQHCRILIYARKHLGRLPTKAEYEDIRLQKYKTILEPDISASLIRGETNMVVYTMKCIGYDSAFQKKVAEKFANWVPPPRKPKGSGKRKEPPAGPKGRKLTKRQKLEEKIIDIDLLSSDEEEPAEDEDEEEEEDSDVEDDELERDQSGWERRYRPRGTRSRPAAGM